MSLGEGGKRPWSAHSYACVQLHSELHASNRHCPPATVAPPAIGYCFLLLLVSLKVVLTLYNWRLSMPCHAMHSYCAMSYEVTRCHVTNLHRTKMSLSSDSGNSRRRCCTQEKQKGWPLCVRTLECVHT